MNTYNEEKLGSYIREVRDTQIIPLDDVMSLVEAMTHLKAQNIEL